MKEYLLLYVSKIQFNPPTILAIFFGLAIVATVLGLWFNREKSKTTRVRPTPSATPTPSPSGNGFWKTLWTDGKFLPALVAFFAITLALLAITASTNHMDWWELYIFPHAGLIILAFMLLLILPVLIKPGKKPLKHALIPVMKLLGTVIVAILLWKIGHSALEQRAQAAPTTTHFIPPPPPLPLPSTEGQDPEVCDAFAFQPDLRAFVIRETNCNQYERNADGSIDETRVRHGIEDKDDTCAAQINVRIHAKELAKSGINIETLEGCVAFSKLLYAEYGPDPWKPHGKTNRHLEYDIPVTSEWGPIIKWPSPNDARRFNETRSDVWVSHNGGPPMLDGPSRFIPTNGIDHRTFQYKLPDGAELTTVHVTYDYR